MWVGAKRGRSEADAKLSVAKRMRSGCEVECSEADAKLSVVKQVIIFYFYLYRRCLNI